MSRAAPIGPTPTARWVASVAAALVRHPALWPAALAQVRRLAPQGWWRRRPFLPVPSAPYLGFRSQTMYGDAARLPEPADVVLYLRWCRDFPHAHRPLPTWPGRSAGTSAEG